jgi:ferredoxin
MNRRHGRRKGEGEGVRLALLLYRNSENIKGSGLCLTQFDKGDNQVGCPRYSFEIRGEKSWVIGPDKCGTCDCEEAVDSCPVAAIELEEADKK